MGERYQEHKRKKRYIIRTQIAKASALPTVELLTADADAALVVLVRRDKVATRPTTTTHATCAATDTAELEEEVRHQGACYLHKKHN